MISVVVPVYNTECYLSQCIESVLSQSYTDLELLLVDDGSTDHSGIICDRYAKVDGRVKVFHQENQGQSVARNYAISKALGQYICFVDSDDFIHPQMLEVLYNQIKDKPTSVVCGGLKEGLYDDVKLLQFEKVVSVTPSESLFNEEAIEKFLNEPYICWVMCGKLFPIEVLSAHKMEEGRFYEDNAVILYWLMNAGSIVIVDEELYYYRINNQGTTKGERTFKKEQDWLWAQEERLLFFINHGMHRLFIRYYSSFLLQAAESFYKYKNEEKKAPLRKKELREWWKKYYKYSTLNEGQQQYLFAVIYPLRERTIEWIRNKRRRRL